MSKRELPEVETTLQKILDRSRAMSKMDSIDETPLTMNSMKDPRFLQQFLRRNKFVGVYGKMSSAAKKESTSVFTSQEKIPDLKLNTT